MVWGAVIGMAAAQVVGMIFYSKMFLGKPWMMNTFPGKTEAQINDLQNQNFGSAYPVCLVAHAGLVVAMHFIIGSFLKVKTIEMAIKIALGLTALAALVDVPHCVFSQRSPVSFVIDHLYNLAVFLTFSVCLVYFG